jgi:hypothetical protein
MINPKQHR